MSGRFEIYRNQAGEYRFRLLQQNGEIVLSSGGYKSKLGCMKGIESVKANSPNRDNYVKEPSTNGIHQFALISLNGRVLGTSRQFATAAAYGSGLASIARLARDARIDDKT